MLIVTLILSFGIIVCGIRLIVASRVSVLIVTLTFLLLLLFVAFLLALRFTLQRLTIVVLALEVV